VEIEKETWLIGQDDKMNYLKVCKEASENEEVFNNFKRNPHYTTILEHDGYNYMGVLYHNHIKNNYPHLSKTLENYTVNDKLGNADIYNHEGLMISPSTLRYVKTLGDIEKSFGSLNEFSIAEIGCGYGGQCLIINETFQFKKYTLFDLPEPCLLINKYLKLNNVETFSFGNLEAECENYDLVISNYAFSECNAKIQDEYIEKVIKKSKRGYLTINAFWAMLERKNADIIVIIKSIHPDLKVEKDSLTNHENYILTWGM
jgi:hypothetical protein